MIGTFTRRTALGIALALTTAPAFAAETIKAVVIDGYPRAMWVQEFTNFFIPEVDKRLAESGNYVMDWQESYGGPSSNPRACWKASSWVWATLASSPRSSTPRNCPARACRGNAVRFRRSRAVAKAVDEIAREFPTMQNEFAAQNQVYLATGVVLDSYQMFSGSRQRVRISKAARWRARYEPALS